MIFMNSSAVAYRSFARRRANDPGLVLGVASHPGKDPMQCVTYQPDLSTEHVTIYEHGSVRRFPVSLSDGITLEGIYGDFSRLKPDTRKAVVRTILEASVKAREVHALGRHCGASHNESEAASSHAKILRTLGEALYYQLLPEERDGMFLFG